MSVSIYVIGKAILFLLAFGLVSSIRFALQRSIRKLEWSRQVRRILIQLTQTSLYLWLAIIGLIALLGYFVPTGDFPPRVLWVLLPPILVIFYLLYSRRFNEILRVIPASWLIYGQSFRALTELFFWMGYLGGYVPLQMTFLWLSFDYTVGLTAPVAGYIFFGRGRFFRFNAIFWNVFGTILVINNLLIATFSLPTDERVFATQPSSVFLTDFPFVWILGFTIPFSLALHLFSLKKLVVQRLQASRRSFRIRRPKQDQ